MYQGQLHIFGDSYTTPEFNMEYIENKSWKKY